MNVVCAWCQAEGKPGILRTVEPLDDPTETHGICSDHTVAWLADSAARAWRQD